MPPFVQTVQPFIDNSDKGRRGLSGYFLLLRGVVKVGAYGWYLDVRMKNKIRHSISIGTRYGSICWNMGKTQKEGPGKVGVLRFCISVFYFIEGLNVSVY